LKAKYPVKLYWKILKERFNRFGLTKRKEIEIPNIFCVYAKTGDAK
jgi:hypothetical protein